MVQINDDYYEDLTPETFGKLLDDLAAGRPAEARLADRPRHAPRREGGADDADRPDALRRLAWSAPGASASQKREAAEQRKAAARRSAPPAEAGDAEADGRPKAAAAPRKAAACDAAAAADRVGERATGAAPAKARKSSDAGARPTERRAGSAVRPRRRRRRRPTRIAATTASRSPTEPARRLKA